LRISTIPMATMSFRRIEFEEIVVLLRLHLYNRGKNHGANANTVHLDAKI